MNPLVSIIINCHNSDQYLNEAIDSCYNQNYENWEIIFFDNASTDNSKKIAKTYDKKLKYYFNNVKLNLGEARNKAIKLAQGEYICFLDCDDVFLENKLLEQVSFMKLNKYLFSYTNYNVINNRGKIIRSYRCKFKSGLIINELLKKYEINFQSSMFNKKVLNNKYFFDSNLQYSPDYNLIMKIASQNQIGVLKKYTVNYRIHKNANSKKQLGLVSKEIKYTLDQIKNNKSISSNSLKYAYNKLYYYDAIYFISINNYLMANKLIKKIRMNSFKYFILSVLIKLNISSLFILKLIRR